MFRPFDHLKKVHPYNVGHAMCLGNGISCDNGMKAKHTVSCHVNAGGLRVRRVTKDIVVIFH